MRGTPLLLSIIGSSGSGKTTLIIKIIKYLSARKLRVGAIKRSHHHVEVDKEGKDSLRFRQAGANPTVLLSDDFFAYMENTVKPTGLGEVALHFAGKADIVLVEGFKEEDSVPKFLFIGSGKNEIDERAKRRNVIGFITDSPGKSKRLNLDKPLFQRDDVEAIAKMILKLIEA